MLIFSKLRSGIWPNYDKIVDIIAEMYQFKKDGKELLVFEIGYAKYVADKDKIPKVFVRKRQIHGKTPQK